MEINEIMNKKQINKMVKQLLEESRKNGIIFTRRELYQRLGGGYSDSQKERIYYRYRYLVYSSGEYDNSDF